MDDLKAGGRQDFDTGFAGDIVRSSAFCKSNFGALRHQVFTDRRYFISCASVPTAPRPVSKKNITKLRYLISI